MYKISCFADEIAPGLSEQLDVMEKLNVGWLSLRSVEDVGVLKLTDEQIDEIARTIKARGVGISSIGSPIGKTPITDTSDEYLRQTERAIQVAEKLDCPRIRVFSFYMEKDEMDTYREEVIERLGKIADLAAKSGIDILHENEARIYGEASVRCRDILESVNRPNFKAVFDPSNFVAAGEDPFDQSLPQVKDFVSYMHIKDSRHSDGVIVPAGEGDGQVSQVLKAFAGQDMFLTLEPHLAVAGQFKGFSGPERFAKAYEALTGLLKTAGIAYR